MGIEKPHFELLEKTAKFEVRAYPSRLILETIENGSFKEASNFAFRKLASYIFGKNEKKLSIPMTAPVEMQMLSQKRWKMWFNVPKMYMKDHLPQSLDPTVKIEEIRMKKYGVKQFSNFCGEKKCQRLIQELRHDLVAFGYKPIGIPIIARYNPPWTLPFFRHNEIFIEVE